MNYQQFLIYFLTGLSAGGLTCMAIQGGLLTSALAQQRAISPESKSWTVVVSFLGARLASYTVLGIALGLIGSILRLSDTVTTLFQIVAILVMIVTALNLLDVHPFFRRFTFQPPSSWRGPLKKLKRSDKWFAPVGLGLFTILLPCGVTQAMMIIAINSGSPLVGGITLFSFIAGTTPIFLLFGLGASALQQKYAKVFQWTAASMLVALSLYSLNGILVANGAPISWQKLMANTQSGSAVAAAPVEGSVQQVVINVTSRGYEPTYIRVKAGQPVKLTLKSVDAYSCALSFRLPEFQISATLAPNDEQAFLLTPTVKGKYNYTCSMGMYTGTLEVI